MLLNSGVDVGKGVLFFPILEQYGKRTALAYQIAEMTLGFGAVFLCALLVLDPADPPIPGGLGGDRLRDAPGGGHR